MTAEPCTKAPGAKQEIAWLCLRVSDDPFWVHMAPPHLTQNPCFCSAVPSFQPNTTCLSLDPSNFPPSVDVFLELPGFNVNLTLKVIA